MTGFRHQTSRKNTKGPLVVQPRRQPREPRRRLPDPRQQVGVRRGRRPRGPRRRRRGDGRARGAARGRRRGRRLRARADARGQDVRGGLLARRAGGRRRGRRGRAGRGERRRSARRGRSGAKPICILICVRRYSGSRMRKGGGDVPWSKEEAAGRGARKQFLILGKNPNCWHNICGIKVRKKHKINTIHYL